MKHGRSGSGWRRSGATTGRREQGVLPHRLIGRTRADLEREVNRHACFLGGVRIEGDGAIHRVDQPLAQGQPEPGASAAMDQ